MADRVAGRSDWHPSSTHLAAVRRFPWARLIVAKPTTFVNDSGDAVVDLLDRFSIELDEILVVTDDVHLDLGRLRLRRGGSDGGHNGLSSIIATTGRRDFARLRFGIGQPSSRSSMIEHVLGTFQPSERETVDRALGRAVETVIGCARDGIERAMNQANLKDDTSSPEDAGT